MEADKAPAKSPAKEEKPKASSAAQVFGLVVSDLTEAQKKDSGLKGGVRVEAATDAAARAGLREGDLILQVGNAEVATVKEFEAVVAKHDKSKALSVLFRRGEWTQYAILKVTK